MMRIMARRMNNRTINHNIDRRVTWMDQQPVLGIMVFITCSCAWLLSGCGDQVRPSTMSQYSEFDDIRRIQPFAQPEKMAPAQVTTGPYKIMPGDVIALTLPAILLIQSTESLTSLESLTTSAYRVDERGRISLPIIGYLSIAGLSLADIEALVAMSYHRTVAKDRPSVFASILEYKSCRVTITGAVTTPGVYKLRNDEMLLSSLLMEAGGIGSTGAKVIRITRIHPGSPPQNTTASNPMSQYSNGYLAANSRMGGGDVTLAHYSRLNANHSKMDTGYDMSFVPTRDHRTTGRLMIKKNDRVMLNGVLDLSRTSQRYALFKKLPGTLENDTIVYLDQQLERLVSQIRGDPYGAVSPAGKSHDNTVEYRSRMAGVVPPMAYINRLSHAYGSHRTNYRLIGDGGQTPTTPIAQPEQTITVPVRAANIPYQDIQLYEGDQVTVEPISVSIFTVIGLVTTPGNYEYPEYTEFNLIEAIGFAGGIDEIAEPRYAVIYRRRSDGQFANTYYYIGKSSHENDYPSAANVKIRPRDIIALEHTPRTRTKVFLDKAFGFQVGAYMPLIR